MKYPLIFTLSIIILVVNAFESGATQDDLFKIFKEKGRNASMTVFPVAIKGTPIKDVGDVLGLMLEQAGMESMRSSSLEFRSSAGSGFEARLKPSRSLSQRQTFKLNMLYTPNTTGRKTDQLMKSG